MCGIVGYYLQGKTTPPNIIDTLKYLYTESIVRGKDATGMAFIQEDKLYYHKNHVPATDYVNEAVFDDITQNKPRYLIGHLRMATKGDPADNKNNHPFISKDYLWAMVHNGIIYNDDKLTALYQLQRKADTDSEVMLRLLEHFYKQEKNIVSAFTKMVNCVVGTITIGLLTQTKELYIFNGGRDIYTAYDTKNKNFFICSMKSVLQSAFTQKMEYGMFPVIENVSIGIVPENNLLIFTPKDVKLIAIKRTSRIELPREKFLFQ
jgi:glucosamine 6-phosphate synthetase-like amidotransferase/phosphosugar isomerase protein